MDLSLSFAQGWGSQENGKVKTSLWWAKLDGLSTQQGDYQPNKVIINPTRLSTQQGDYQPNKVGINKVIHGVNIY